MQNVVVALKYKCKSKAEIPADPLLFDAQSTTPYARFAQVAKNSQENASENSAPFAPLREARYQIKASENSES